MKHRAVSTAIHPLQSMEERWAKGAGECVDDLRLVFEPGRNMQEQFEWREKCLGPIRLRHLQHIADGFSDEVTNICHHESVEERPGNDMLHERNEGLCDGCSCFGGAV